MKLVGKEPIRRLEIAQRQDEAELIGRRAEGTQEML
jgi:hypothetical protein